MKIVLTGHKGFIGSHYYKYIKDRYEDLYPYDKRTGTGMPAISSADLSNPTVTRNAPDCDVLYTWQQQTAQDCFMKIQQMCVSIIHYLQST